MAAEYTNIQRKLLNLANNGEPMRIAVTTVFAEQKARIFERGMSTNQGKIGRYGTNPISISKKRQAKQTGKTYFKGGYAEYKSAIGKNPGFVNLVNTGQMQADYGVLRKGRNFGFGFQNTENFEKTEWAESRFKKDIFEVNDKELNLFSRVIDFEVRRRL